MEKIQFEVSAKTARLIGRENISDVDSAVIELIKNSYDADASCVIVYFDMPFPSVPSIISFELATSVFGETGLKPLLAFYDRSDQSFIKKTNLSQKDEKELEVLLYSKNRIIIMDNGHGMDSITLRTAWMNIGTSFKEERKVSPGGRVKTGAKGIGRFALDKLSTYTTVYTKSATDKLLKWCIDWNQFETASLLGEVNATFEKLEVEYYTLAKCIAGEKVKSFDDYDWKTGTIILLTPTREMWSIYYFDKVIRNLKSIFPYTENNQFDIYVYNQFLPKYSFENERFSLQDSEFDYKINAKFDGVDELVVELHRNEVDTRKMKSKVEKNGVVYDLSLSEFWSRSAFRLYGYSRSDYSKIVTFKFSASSLIKVSKDALMEVGPFTTELYFLKNSNSMVDIIKSIVTSRRKEILSNFSGIKLYRDGFKVRPYGEEGPSFDWLDLGTRAQKSPVGVSHPDGSWRVLPYQLIGAVRISRDLNPNLSDMANREGLAVNNAYRTFISLLHAIIDTFEGDRQLVYREYAQWTRQKILALSKANEVIEAVKAKTQKENTDSSLIEDNKKKNTSKNEYTNKEYESAVAILDTEKERQERLNQTMMLYGAAGVMTNTFSHEISRIATNTGSRMQHLRACVKFLIGKDGYKGDPDFNPLPLIDEAENTDKLIECWVNVIMNGMIQSKFTKTTIHPQKVIQEIIDVWIPLLEKKFINIKPLRLIDLSEKSLVEMPEIDFHIILNNFLLNSAWFLEHAKSDQREICITIADKDNIINITLENNGPPLDTSFHNNPNLIFEAGVSTKKTDEVTGLGLWITRTVIENNSGEIHVMNKDDGFGLRILLPKLR